MRYPSSASEAEALAPARPEPTTMTWYLRLLAGFTSFISKRCFSHFCSSGPDGTFERRSIGDSRLLDHAEQDGEREGDVAHHHDGGDHRGQPVGDLLVARVAQAERPQ